MFLKQIKIVGFKSFVEPTILYFKTDRVAIVGPNGCGKSNVIDAIRWVMGESSPKFLRGDLMADVIFNGSLQRKPLGMASVEIILDNHQSYLQGAYVIKGDVALRREVNRLGESSYFINGQKVRRKDLTDLWLGTGAGARGYAIIGQNMVNHLVEANPEVLRGYLEEAAGVSKYKERRRESADRLNQVSENLVRLADIIFELEGQIERLEKEAIDAKQYHHLRQELRQYEEQLELAKARALHTKHLKIQDSLAVFFEQEQQISKQCALLEQELSALEQKISKEQHDVQIEEQQLFKRQVESEQQEKSFLQRKQEYQHYQNEVQDVQQETQLIDAQLESEKQNIVSQNENLELLNKQTLELGQQIQVLKDQEQVLKNKMRSGQQERFQIRQQQNQHRTEFQVILAKQEQAKLNLTQYQEQIQHWKQLLKNNDISHVEHNISKYNEMLAPKEYLLGQLQEKLNLLQLEFSKISSHFNEMTELKNIKQMHFDECARKKMLAQASYEGLLTNHDEKSIELDGAHPWVSIVEWLKSTIVPIELQKTMDWFWQQLLPSYIGHIEAHELPSFGYYGALLFAEDYPSAIQLPRLLDVLGMKDYPASFVSWNSIKVAPNSDIAFQFRPLLSDNESILTLSGIWLGKDWLFVLPIHEQKSEGIATRLNAFKLAEINLKSADEELIKQSELYNHVQSQYLKSKESIELQQKGLDALIYEINHMKQAHQAYQQELKFLAQEHARNQQELGRCEEKYAFIVSQLKEWTTQLELLKSKEVDLEQSEYNVSDMLDKLQLGLNTLEDELANKLVCYDSERHQQVKTQTEYDFYLQNIPKIEIRKNKLQERYHQLLHAISQYESEPDITVDYFIALRQSILTEQTILNQKKEAFLKEINARQDLSLQLEQIKKQQLVFLEKKWRITAEKEQIDTEIAYLKTELNTDFSSELWQNLTKDQDDTYFKRLILEKEAEISQLGDVNLLAVGLYEQEKQRYEHVLAQQKDLQQAMDELKSAIETLDEDMQKQLQITLSAINNQLLIIFPKLFGGGEAKFVASCDNLLEATVAVQVQLPGKKQHRIQLLSGGEKALTAVALLFAIFALNPAPFCLLDEVDAALDDANVLRLVALIKEMSKTVQFILITHNPLSMDVADELIGVTMQEPGVSRVVAVNMAMALAMVNKE